MAVDTGTVQVVMPVMGDSVAEGTVLWEPSEERKAAANLTRYLRWLRETKGLSFDSYDQLWAWSVADLDGFGLCTWATSCGVPAS